MPFAISTQLIRLPCLAGRVGQTNHLAEYRLWANWRRVVDEEVTRAADGVVRVGVLGHRGTAAGLFGAASLAARTMGAKSTGKQAAGAASATASLCEAASASGPAGLATVAAGVALIAASQRGAGRDKA